MWRKKEIQNKIQHELQKNDCDNMLMALLGGQELIDRWWNSPNMHFDFKHPIDILIGTDFMKATNVLINFNKKIITLNDIEIVYK